MEPTRIIYDRQTINSQQALKHITDENIACRRMKWVTPEDVDVNTNLRPNLTNKNYSSNKNTELFGTAPYRASGRLMTLVDTESKLYHGDHSIKCNKPISSRFDRFNAPLVDDSNLRGRSTRSDLKNCRNRG